MPYKHKISPDVRAERRRQRTFKSVPKGHRLLRYGEMIRAGDLIWLGPSGGWKPTCLNVGLVKCSHFCRPNATPPHGEQPTKSLGIENA